MKKIIALVLALTLALTLAACGGKADSKTIKVGTAPGPHAEIMEAVADLIVAEGYTLEVVEFSDYVLPNTALDEGEIDANYFQHITYMNSFNEEHGLKMVSAAGIHYEPFGLYAGKTASIAALAEGAKIAVPNDPSNEARALLLLEAQGLIKLSEEAGLEATPNDIVENPKNLTFVELEAAMVPNTLSEVDIAVINVNYALEAGFNPVKDALAIESADSPYVNILVVKEGNEDNAAIKALIEALHSDTVRDFIEEKYEGAVVPAF